MDDVVSRQAVIRIAEQGQIQGFEWQIKKLLGMPSAEPEIVRCKDCKWGREACGNIECFIDFPSEYHGYEWFCPNGKRRTG